MKKISLLFIIPLFFLTNMYGDEAEEERGVAELSYTNALILGVVQGVTEFLPISSTGHLIITSKLLDLDEEEQVNGSKYTMKRATNAYLVVIQGGSILALVMLYWGRIVSMVMGLMGRDLKGLMLARNLLIAFLPAAVMGLLFHRWIEHHLFRPWAVIIALIMGAFLMFFAEKRRGGGLFVFKEKALHEISGRDALVVGLMQCMALWPGASRSMVTIVGGYFIGLSPAKAAEFSFMLGLVTLSAAAIYEAFVSGPEIVTVLEVGPVLFGIFIAFVVGALIIKWLLSYLSRHGILIFAWYRLVLALVCFGIFYAFR